MEGEASRMVEQFVGGTYRLSITSRALAELLGIGEDECRAALDAMADGGIVRRSESESDTPLYYKD